MHEFSIALNIIEIAETEAVKAKGSAVRELELEIGTMAGIEFDALDTALEMAVKNTMLEDCRMVVHKIKARAKCRDCGTEFSLEQVYDPCPECNSPFHEILKGKELRVKSLVVDTPA
jgi:hydrogenase nickel incorporation protein HypA/HybF